jgi:flagellar protein FliJ
MKSRDTLIRLKRFQVDDKRRRVAQIEMMIAEFDRMAADLDREIAAEEQKAGITDPNHFAYPTYARAAGQRRDNLRQSAENLHAQLDDAKAELGEAFEELKKAESLEDRERSAERGIEAVRDQPVIGHAGSARALRASA